MLLVNRLVLPDTLGLTTLQFLLLLLHPPLPLPEDGEEGPEVELGPQDRQEDDLRRFVALPEHEVGEALYARGTDEEVQGRVGVLAGEGVGCYGSGGYEFGGGIG